MIEGLVDVLGVRKCMIADITLKCEDKKNELNYCKKRQFQHIMHCNIVIFVPTISITF